MKEYVRVDIVDNDNGFKYERIMDTYILENPSMEKIEKLQEMLNNRFVEENEFTDDYGAIHDYISKNFTILNVPLVVEVEW